MSYFTCNHLNCVFLLSYYVCVFTICSPVHPPPVLDLRTIMDMEANSVQTTGATPKSPGRYEMSASFTNKQFFTLTGLANRRS